MYFYVGRPVGARPTISPCTESLVSFTRDSVCGTRNAPGDTRQGYSICRRRWRGKAYQLLTTTKRTKGLARAGKNHAAYDADHG